QYDSGQEVSENQLLAALRFVTSLEHLRQQQPLLTYQTELEEPPDDIVAGIEEQLSGACTTEIAAFDEFTALLTNQQLRNEYDHI
ncbi:STY4199 family HEPN domain-containing protein, partial [Salmonella enterica subsp. enterica serovar Anatum]|nr:STY4199 family HEPN domain-containing protein [Salmonella enterica subsp. enterica serovar Anatum]